MKRKNMNKFSALLLAFAILLSLIPAGPANASGESTNNYYVDSINGDDNNDGTDMDKAWKTLLKVNSTTFQPGDRILFKAGCSWEGQLWPKGSGVEGSSIIIDKYGGGEKPLINGGPIGSSDEDPTPTPTPISEPENPMPNMMVNPGLESGDATGWQFKGDTTVVNNNQGTGSYAVKVNSGSDSAAEQVVTGLKPNTTYRLKVWTKVENEPGKDGAQICLGMKEYGNPEAGVRTSSLTYTQLSIEFTTGATNTSARIFLWYSGSSGWAYGDDFEVKEVVTVVDLTNPGFESNDKTGWVASDAWNIVNNNQYAGDYCAQIPANASAEMNVSGLMPNTYYRFSAWVKVGTESEVAYLGVKDYGGQEISKKTSSTTYTQLKVDFLTGAEQTTATIYLKRDNSGSGYAYGDDFDVRLLPQSLIPKDDPNNKVSNFGFETGVMSPWVVTDEWSVVNDNQKKGEFSAQIKPSGVAQQTITGLKKNKGYKLRAFVKVEDETTVAQLGVKDYGGLEVSSVTSSTDYKFISVDFTTGADSTTATVYLKNAAGEGLVFGDDFELTERGSETLKLRNQSYWEINNLQITNYGTAGIEAKRRAVYVEAADQGTISHIYLKNLNIHDVNGGDPNHKNLDYESGGIIMLVNDDFQAPDVKSKFDDVLIEGCTFKNVSKEGIFIRNNYRLRGGFTAENTPDAIGEWYPNTNVVIRNNSLDTIGGDGIVAAECQSPLIEYNVAKDCHNDHEFWCVAIWSINCDDAVIQNNEAYGTKTTDDGQGFDIDWNQRRTIMQYNYSHDNEGGFMLMCCWYGESFNDDSIVRYNISQNDLCRIFEIHGPVKNSQIYNNTIYVRAGIAPKIYNMDWWDSTDGRYPENTYNYNNIIYNLGNGGYNFTNSVNTVFDNNCFYGKHPNSEPADAHKITSDPMLVNPGTGVEGRDSVNGYQLQGYSPLINAGRTIPGNGGKDFWGNPVPYNGGKTDIGAFEFQGVKQPNPNNKLQNPGFESGEADPWNVGISEVVYDNQYDGNYCIKVAKNSSAEQSITGLTPDTTYILKAWVKVEDESDVAYLGVKNYGGEDKAVTTSSTDYTQLSVEFTTGATDETATVYLWRSDTGTGSAYGDDFEIMPAAAATPPPPRVNVLKPNQGFEDGSKTGWSTDGTNEVVGTNQHSGNYCIEITPGNSIERLVTGLRPDTDYTLRAWAKVEGGSGVVYLGAKNYGYDEIAANTSSSSYVQLSVDFTTGPTDTSVKIYLWRDGTGEGSAFGDDFEILGTLSTPTPLDTVPTANQIAWQHLELTAFAHFGMNTFTGAEWGTGTEDPSLFNPTDFNAAQWVSTLQDAGFKMLILTAKHHDGFCLWPSAYTTHDVASSPWRDGEGDVVKEVADACHAAGMKFGIYLSPWDRHEPSYGPGGDDYNVYYMNQLRELLTNYGEISEVWMDGANDNTKPQDYNIYQWADLVHELQPTAVIFQGNFDIRWAGNERGVADEPCWATVDENRTPVPGGTRWMPAECDVPIRPGWFYHESEDTQVKSLNDLAYIYKNSVGLGANLLLSVSPDKRGLIPYEDVNRLNEFKNYMEVTYGNNLAQGATATASVTRDVYYDASYVLDNDKATYWAAPDGENTASLTLDLGSMKEFDMVELQEPIELGQRITSYNIEAWNGNSWIPLATKQSIGNKVIVQFEPVIASKVRLNITNALACPAIRTIKVYLEAEVRCKAIGGTVAASTENPPNEPKENAFDDSSATKWLTLANNGWIQYDFKDEKSYAINRYTITSANDVPARDPKDWTLKGSNDGVTWETLDTRKGITFDNRFQTLSFNIPNTTYYKINRLDITANNGDSNMQLAEVELYGAALPLGDLCTGGEVTTSSENVNPEWNQDHYANHAFDDVLGDSKWMTLEKPAWIQYDFAGDAAYAVKSYSITSANENEPGRDPKDWTFEGSNDGTTWDIVDTRTGEMFEGRLLKKTYNFENTTPYKMYRLNISTNRDTAIDWIQLAEIEMFAVHQLPPDSEAPAAPAGLAVTNNTGSSVTIAWETSADNVAVTGYEVYRNGTKIGTTATTSYTDSTVEGETAYIYTVKAFDAVQNTSEASAELSITTPVVLVDICTGGLATASSQNTLWGNNHIAEHAFDNGNDWSQWMTLALSTPINAWIQYDFTDELAYVVNSYSITSSVDAPQRDPKSWTFEGSNDGTTWVPLDKIEGETFESRLLKKTYNFNNTTAYKMYRLNITDSIGPEILGGNEYYVQILEIEMFGTLGSVQPPSKTKVALVGDSITDMGIYPSELQKMLGTDYIVKNYGQSGCTMLKSGDYPYWNQQDYTDSTSWLPDVVVIMLGTNDSKGYNWDNGEHEAEFLSNYKEMINHYKDLASHPTVYVNTCPTVYLADSGDINESIIKNEIIPLISQAATETGATIIDVHSATAGMEGNFPDKVHPNSAGSRIIAGTVYAGMKGSAAPILPEDLCVGGTATANSDTNNQGAHKLFDDNIFFSKWMVIGSTGWVQYDFEGESTYAVNGYSIISADDEATRDPKNWTLEGSTDGTDWTVVDSRANESFSSRSQMKTYTFINDNQYKMYRLNISANQGGNELQIAEIELFAAEETADTEAPSAPTGLSLTNTTGSSITITWEASSDNVAVVGYDVYRNGTKIGTTTTTSYTDSTVEGETSYIYTVKAFDAIQNTSEASAQLNVTTPTSRIDLCIGGEATATSENVNPEWGQNHNAGNAFDDQLGWTKWMSLTTCAAIQYDFAGDTSYAVNGYSITSAAEDEPGRDPKDWTLEGSNDGITWNIVDARTDETFESRLLKKTYSFNNTTAYKMYRLNITANHGAQYIQIAEIEMFGSSGIVPDKTPGDFSLTSPADEAIGQSLTTTLTWEAAEDAVSYNLVVSVNDDFSSPVVSTAIESNSYQLFGLEYDTTYYWKVTAINGTAIKEATNNRISFKTLVYSRPEDTYITPVKTSPDSIISSGTVKIIPKLDDNSNKAKSDLTPSDYAKALESAQSDEDGVKTVVLEVEKVDKAAGYVQKLPAAAVTALDEMSKITIKTELSDITIPGNMLSNVDNISASRVEISIEKADTNKLSEEIRSKIGSRPVIDVKLLIDEKVVAWSNNNALVKISIPYIPSAEELKSPDHIVIWYIGSNNEVIPITNGRYDAKKGVVVFTTNHLSVYAVSFVNKSFNDIDSYPWAKHAIEVLASKGVISGTSDKTFNPERDITRADFMVLLIKALGLTAEFDTNFNDVDENKYYYNAIGVAKELGIVSGVGNNRFNPTSKISRQDMMVITAKALKLAGKLGEQVKHADLNLLKDESKIAKYALDSVSILVGEGIIEDDNSCINPLRNATRAETAVIIYNAYNVNSK